jgi:hypothetical protein
MSSVFKGLTQKQIDKRFKEGRGQGQSSEYKPFIFVHEVSSDGRVNRVYGHKSQRIHHLLSDLELAVFLLLDWQENVLDVREQFPMRVEDTKRISEDAGLPHQKFNGIYQVLTTDFVIDCQDEEHPRFALQAKYSDELEKPSTIERLELERRYWKSKNIPWYIITEKEIPKTVLDNIKWLYPIQQDKLQNSDLQHYYQLFISEFEKQPKQPLVTITQKIDLAYELEIGTALYWLRNLLAKRFLVFDIEKPYQKLKVEDLVYNAHQEDEVTYASA